MTNNIKGIEINEKEKICIVYINPKIYSLDVIYSAAYVFTDRAYLILDGDTKKKVKVILKPKKEYDLNKLGMEFNNELLNYAVYKEQSNKTKGVREAIMQRALVTNDPSILEEDELFDDNPDFDEDIEDYLDDPEGIAIPWEEKYGKGNSKSKPKKNKK